MIPQTTCSSSVIAYSKSHGNNRAIILHDSVELHNPQYSLCEAVSSQLYIASDWLTLSLHKISSEKGIGGVPIYRRNATKVAKAVHKFERVFYTSDLKSCASTCDGRNMSVYQTSTYRSHDSRSVIEYTLADRTNQCVSGCVDLSKLRAGSATSVTRPGRWALAWQRKITVKKFIYANHGYCKPRSGTCLSRS